MNGSSNWRIQMIENWRTGFHKIYYLNKENGNIDAPKIESELRWKADEDFKSGIELIIEWYLKQYLLK